MYVTEIHEWLTEADRLEQQQLEIENLRQPPVGEGDVTVEELIPSRNN